jgi:hypothetical protein
MSLRKYFKEKQTIFEETIKEWGILKSTKITESAMTSIVQITSDQLDIDIGTFVEFFVDERFDDDIEMRINMKVLKDQPSEKDDIKLKSAIKMHKKSLKTDLSKYKKINKLLLEKSNILDEIDVMIRRLNDIDDQIAFLNTL